MNVMNQQYSLCMDFKWHLNMAYCMNLINVKLGNVDKEIIVSSEFHLSFLVSETEAFR